MKQRHGKLFFAAGLCTVFLLSGLVMAALVRQTQDTVTLQKGEAATEQAETVTSETALKTAGTGAFWSDRGETSQAGGRKIIRLANDITFHTHKDEITVAEDALCNMELTADCNLDLGGKTLNLNGHTLTIRHDYHGEFAIYNGTITGGKLVIQTPNAWINLTDATISATVDVTFRSNDEAALADYLFDRVEDALYTGDRGGYFIDDLPLPQGIGCYNVRYNYTSNKPTVLDNAGVLHTEALTGLTPVTLTLNLTFESGSTKSREFSVQVGPPASPADWCQVGVDQLFWKAYFSQYDAGNTGSYTVSNRVLLPKSNPYLKDGSGNTLVYSYRVFDYTDGKKGDEKSAYLIDTADTVVFNSDIGSSVLWLECTASIGDVSYTSGGNVVVNAHTDLSAILKELFDVMYPDGEVIVGFDGANYQYAQSVLITDTAYVVNGGSLASRGITNINYRIYTGSEAEHDVYYIEHTDVATPGYPEVQVRNGASPDTLNIAVVEAQVSFGTATKTSVYLRVIYEDETENQNFAPYYSYLNSLMMTVRTNYLTTYTSFEMPSKIGRKPYVEYMLKAVNANGELIDFDLEPYITVENIDPAVDNSGAPAKFVIHTDQLLPEDIYVQVVYRYKFSSRGATSFQTYEDASTILTLPGMIHDPVTIPGSVNPAEIPDGNLFDAIYTAYGNSDTYPSAAYGTVRMIFTDALSDMKETFSASNRTIGSLQGVEYLQNTKNIDFYGCGLTTAVMTGGEPYLNQLGFAEMLDLGGNVLTSWGDGHSWLSDMHSLKVLKIDGNKIERFYNLTGYPALEELWVFGQQVTQPTFLGFITLNLYGENGWLNTAAISSAVSAGIAVHNSGDRDNHSQAGGSGDENMLATSSFIADMAYQKKKTPTATANLDGIYSDSPQMHEFLRSLGSGQRDFRSNTNISGSSVSIQLQYYSIFWWADAGTVFSRDFTYENEDELLEYVEPSGTSQQAAPQGAESDALPAGDPPVAEIPAAHDPEETGESADQTPAAQDAGEAQAQQ